MGDFSVHEDKLFMDLLKRRAYMMAFPGEMKPIADDIFLEVKYDDNGCCGHDTVDFYVGKRDHKPVKMRHQEIAEFLREFFGVEDA